MKKLKCVRSSKAKYVNEVDYLQTNKNVHLVKFTDNMRNS